MVDTLCLRLSESLWFPEKVHSTVTDELSNKAVPSDLMTLHALDNFCGRKQYQLETESKLFPIEEVSLYMWSCQ